MDYLIIGTQLAACTLANELSTQGHTVTLAGLTPPAITTPATYFPLSEISPLELKALFTFLADALPHNIVHMLELIEDEQHRPERKLMEVDLEWLHRVLSLPLDALVLLSQQIDHHYARERPVGLYCILSDLSQGPYGQHCAYSHKITQAALRAAISELQHEWQQHVQKHHLIPLTIPYHPHTISPESHALVMTQLLRPLEAIKAPLPMP